MHLVKPMANYFFLCVIFLLIYSISYSQENSPFSRYGIGDLYPQQNVASRGMGGLSAAFTSSQAINTMNPASYGALNIVTYEFGLSIDSRSLLSKTPVDKYKSINFLPSYLQFGVPLTKPGNKNGAGLVFGIRPSTRINYSVEEGNRIYYDSLGTSDSLHGLHEGNGGLNQVFFGLGKTWKFKEKDKNKPNYNSVSVGFNAGYEWGTKFISNKVDFPSDSTYENWYHSNSTDSTQYWGFFLNPGIMASFKLKEYTNPLSKIINSYVLVVGGSGTIEQDLNATRALTRETFYYQSNGEATGLDSVLKVSGVKGRINIPASFNGGFMLNKMLSNGPFQIKKWSVGVDYSFTQWTKYLNYGLPDRLEDSWFLRAGVEYSPNPLGNTSVFSTGIYRFGYYTGKDYQNADGNGYDVHAFTLGYSFNLKRYHSYEKQFTMINTAIEFGKRGSGVNNVTENFFKFSLGLSLSDIWFIKRKYD
jgi:hypothetical protein